MKQRVSCIIQARMGSTRLPKKVLLPILDKPMLWWGIQRLQRTTTIDEIVVATTVEPADQAIVDVCHQYGWHVYRGSEHDVLDRYYQAAQTIKADHVVRITSDCPLIDPHIIDYVVSAHLSAAPMPDYTSNTLKRTYPRGLDVECVSYSALRRCWEEATSAPAREHVTYHIYQHPQQYMLHHITNLQDYSQQRWTVDTPEDLQFVRTVYEHFGHGDFSWQEVLQVLADHPDWAAINQHIEQKKP